MGKGATFREQRSLAKDELIAEEKKATPSRVRVPPSAPKKRTFEVVLIGDRSGSDLLMMGSPKTQRCLWGKERLFMSKEVWRGAN